MVEGVRRSPIHQVFLSLVEHGDLLLVGGWGPELGGVRVPRCGLVWIV